MKKLLIFIFFISFSDSIGQRICNTNTVFERRLASVSGLRDSYNRYLTFLRNRVENYPLNPALHRNPIIIPVVVHVVYNTPAQNISEAQINSQIEALNRAFRKRNASEIAAIPSTTYKSRASDCLVEFRLAARKPDGTATNGITRRATTVASFTDNDDIKRAANGVVPWDASKYLNIWVGKLSGGLLGYAAFPWDNDPNVDGVVIDVNSFGTTGGPITANFNQGKTAVHEVAHYLGLWHIWGDMSNDPTGCAVDDEVSDTPSQRIDNTGCPTFPHVSCGNTPDGDMFMNYMDYVHDRCMSMFSTGQRIRMLSSFAPGGKRASLALSNGLLPPNSSAISYEVFTIPETSSIPSWKSAMGMVWATARQQSPDIPGLEAASGPFTINGLPNDVATTIHALVLNYQEILVCYSTEGFRNLLRRGPIALLSLGANDKFGLVVSGMSIAPNGNAILTIKDPMSVGPRFGFTQTGSEYQVEYNTFMTQNLEQLARENKRIFIIYPPSSGGI